jgi:phage tail protein X
MTYTTKQGDRWDSISYMVLGSERYMGQIIAANKQHREVFLFPAGVVLEIPEISDSAESDDTVPPWRR